MDKYVAFPGNSCNPETFDLSKYSQGLNFDQLPETRVFNIKGFEQSGW